MENFILPVLLVGMFYLVLFLPQQRRKKEYAALQESLVEGDEVLLSSGMYGFISILDGKTAWIEISENVEIKVNRDSIAQKISLPDEDDADSAVAEGHGGIEGD